MTPTRQALQSFTSHERCADMDARNPQRIIQYFHRALGSTIRDKLVGWEHADTVNEFTGVVLTNSCGVFSIGLYQSVKKWKELQRGKGILLGHVLRPQGVAIFRCTPFHINLESTTKHLSPAKR